MAGCQLRRLLALRLALPISLVVMQPFSLLGEENPPQEAGFVAPRVVRMVEAVYPPGITSEPFSGDVRIKFGVAADGTVTSMVVESGPPAFVDSALAAAKALQFEPATQGGQAVASTQVVTFHFRRPPPVPYVPTRGMFDTIVIEGKSERSYDSHVVTTLDEAVLEREAGQDLAEALASVPGVVVARGSADASKPIIRGLYERRLLVMFDGVRHESQKWGADHATEIDPFAAGEISVIKGASGVRYGPDALGGVVLVQPPQLRDTSGVGGEVRLIGVSNGARGSAAGRLDVAVDAVPGLSLRMEGDYSHGAAISTPNYVLGNTGSTQWNVGGASRYVWEMGSVDLSYRHYDFSAGVCYCVNNSSADEFYAQLDADAPVGSENWTVSYDVGRPYQDVRHDVVLARMVRDGGNYGILRVTYAFQVNQRQEFEQSRESVTGPQYDFTLRTHSLDVEYSHNEVSAGDHGKLLGGYGATSSFQENVYSGLPLIPNFRAVTGGVFGYERLTLDSGSIEAGVRYDRHFRASFLTESAYDRHISRGTLSEEDCELTGSAAKCDLSFDAATLSLGGLWSAIEDHLDLKLDLSSASRFPNGDELYMNGSAPTFPVYALGDPSLKVETTWGVSPTVGMRLGVVEGEISGFTNYINNYIYFAPELGPEGEPVFDVTIRGSFPRFTYRPVDTVFYGVDGSVSLAPVESVSFTVHGSLVRADDLLTGEPLLFIPPPRLGSSVRYEKSRLGRFHKNYLEVSGDFVARQNHVNEDADLAPAPDAYFLAGAGLGGEIHWAGDRTLKIGLEGHNLLNVVYRDYTSLLRYYADESGRELRLRAGCEF